MILLLALALVAQPRQTAPLLDVSPTRVSFISHQQPRVVPTQIRIRNTGSGRLLWRATSRESWITLTPANGVAPSMLLLGIDPSELEPGTYLGHVVVDAGRVAGSPRVIEVRVIITEPKPVAASALKASPERVTFATPLGQGEPLSFPVQLDAEGDRAVRWQASSQATWMSVAPAEGTTPAELRITVTPTDLPAGDHAADVRITTSGGQTLDLPVTLSLRTSGGALEFVSTTMPAATLNLPYSEAVPVRGGRPPYSIQLASGQLPPDLALINGVVTGIPRQPGTFAFSITVTDSATLPDSATQLLTLPVVILDQGTSLDVQPTAVNLVAIADQSPPSVVLAINSGGAALSWRASTDAPWVRMIPTTGVAPASLSVGADPTGLSAGIYQGTLTITMTGAPNSPARIPVQLLVRR